MIEKQKNIKVNLMSQQDDIQKLQDEVSKLDRAIFADIKLIKEGCKEANERESNQRYNHIKVC